MWTESEIQSCKKNFLDEVRNMISPETPPLLWSCLKFNPEELIDGFFEKAKNMDFSEIRDETPLELVSHLDDNFVYDPALSREENFRNGVCLLKEFWRIEQKQH